MLVICRLLVQEEGAPLLSHVTIKETGGIPRCLHAVRGRNEAAASRQRIRHVEVALIVVAVAWASQDLCITITCRPYSAHCIRASCHEASRVREAHGPHAAGVRKDLPPNEEECGICVEA